MRVRPKPKGITTTITFEYDRQEGEPSGRASEGRDMAYQSDTIATVVNRLNVRYFLPAIQREFVWKPDQIIQLFDSLLRNYPMGEEGSFCGAIGREDEDNK